jgi:cytochrome c biogenesis protein CcdA
VNNNNWLFSIALGISLIAIGLMLMRSHLRSWKSSKNDGSLEDRERTHLYTRYRRRMQASGMITGLGILFPLGDILFSFLPLNAQNQIWFAIYWLIVLLLAGWLIVLALADMYSTSIHAKTSLNKVRRKQRELERQVAEIKRRESNGRGLPRE